MLNLFEPLASTGRLRRAPSRIVVVIAGPNPSFDLYLRPRLDELGPSVDVMDIGDAPSGDAARKQLAGAFVLFCRYTSGAWMRAVESHADTISGVGLFIDDDIDALAADRQIPLWYRLRLVRLHLIHRRRLQRQCDILLVGSPILAARCAAAHPRVLTPHASEEDQPVSRENAGRFRVAFHSSSVHRAEHNWLRPVIHSALDAEPSMFFTVIAGWPLSGRWRNLPRTTIAAPMSWPHYRAMSREHGADLLLAPLLPSAANAARSWTKRIDAMRLGAALMVSDPDVYRPDPEEQSLGMCVPPDPALWRNAILELTRDRSRLTRLRDLNREYVLRASAADEPRLLS